MAASEVERGPFARRAVSLMLVAVILAGFINLVPAGGAFPSTIVTDVLTALLLCGAVIELLRRRTAITVDPWMIALGALLAAYLVGFIVSDEPIAARLIAMRSSCLYAFVAIFVAVKIRTSSDLEWLQRLFVALAVFIAAFGIAQSYLPLPTALLTPKDSQIFTYFGTDVVRSNGLVGNTIVYSITLLLVFAVLLARAFATDGPRRFIPVAIVAVAIFSTSSRAALLGAILVGGFLLVASRRNLGRAIGSVVSGLFGVGVLVALAYCIVPVWEAIIGSFIVQELFLGRNASVQGSNLGHSEDIRLAIDLFKQDPIWGHGLASSGGGSVGATYGRIIQDGGFWARLAEGGLILTAAWLVLVLAVARACWQAWQASDRTNWLALGVLGFSVYEFGFAAFVNSGWFGKTPFILYWVLFGLAMAVERIRRQQASDATGGLPSARPLATR